MVALLRPRKTRRRSAAQNTVQQNHTVAQHCEAATYCYLRPALDFSSGGRAASVSEAMRIARSGASSILLRILYSVAASASASAVTAAFIFSHAALRSTSSWPAYRFHPSDLTS